MISRLIRDIAKKPGFQVARSFRTSLASFHIEPTSCSVQSNLSKVKSEEHAFLRSLGFEDDASKSLLQSFEKMGAPATVATLRGFGLEGLQSLLQAVERDEANSKKRSKQQMISIRIRVKNAKEDLVVSAFEGDTLQSLCERGNLFISFTSFTPTSCETNRSICLTSLTHISLP
jgi:hypothetical protein